MAAAGIATVTTAAEHESSPLARTAVGSLWQMAGLVLLLSARGGGGRGGGGSAPTLMQDTILPAPTPPPPTSSTGPLAFSSLEGMRTATRVEAADNPREVYMRACMATLRHGNEVLLRTLPLLGMEFANTTVDDIMTWVLVSPDWVGKNFRSILETMPREVRLRTRAVSTINISDDIHLSFYTG